MCAVGDDSIYLMESSKFILPLSWNIIYVTLFTFISLPVSFFFWYSDSPLMAEKQ